MRMMFQQPKLPNTMNTFMEKFGWQALLLSFTIIATIIGTVILGKIQLVDFNWLMLLLGAFSFALLVFGLWSFYKATRKYQEDIAALQQKNHVFEDETTKRVDKELDRLNNLYSALSQDIETKQRERFEELEKQCMETISDAKNVLESRIINTETNFSNAVSSIRGAMESQRQCILDILQPKMDELKDMIMTRQVPNEQEGMLSPHQESSRGV